MFEHFRRFPWVLTPVAYDNPDQLIREIETLVIAPVDRWLEKERARASS